MFNQLVFNPTEPKFKKGEKTKILLEGAFTEVEIIDTTIEDFYRKYHLKFSDGSSSWFYSNIFDAQLN